MIRIRAGSRAYWALVALYVTVLFSLQPQLGFWVEAFKERWGDAALDRTAWAAAAGAGVLVAALVGLAWRRARPAERAVFVIAMLLYGLGVAILDTPQERLHYFEYGMLSALIYGGLSAREPTANAWRHIVVAVVVTSAAGYLDEKLQDWFWERRYFDWRDVRLNIQAALLGVATSVPFFNGRRRMRREPPTRPW